MASPNGIVWESKSLLSFCLFESVEGTARFDDPWLDAHHPHHGIAFLEVSGQKFNKS